MAGFAVEAVPGFFAAVPVVPDCGLAAEEPEEDCGFADGACAEPEVGGVCANALAARSALEARRINENVCVFFIQLLSQSPKDGANPEYRA